MGKHDKVMNSTEKLHQELQEFHIIAIQSMTEISLEETNKQKKANLDGRRQSIV